jgi:predicted nucleotidyltransferase component of viral defense system
MEFENQCQIRKKQLLMIPQSEILAESARWGIQQQVVEKDYALGWLLAGIAQHPDLKDSWIFKGGTCLRKCYYETFRFSEDLDFTVIQGGPYDPKHLTDIFQEISAWSIQQVGIKLEVDESSFRSTRNKRGKPTLQAKIGFVGPQAKPTVPKVKIDITNDELLARSPVYKKIFHSYSDWPGSFEVSAYSLEELAAEKIRALYERCRPRDLYDVIHLYTNLNLVGMSGRVRSLLSAKCDYVGIDMPTAAKIKTDENLANLRVDWDGMLAHQLPSPLLSLESFWNEIDQVFEWLDGRSPLINLSSAQMGSQPTTLVSANSLNFARQGFNMQLLRYSAFNKLKIRIFYESKQGGIGPRLVEPYSLRRTQEGNVLLYAINQNNELRSYRLDRIYGMEPSNQSYIPSYRVEIS